MSLPGCDISEHNTGPLFLASVEFVFIRAAYGGHPDALFAQHLAGVYAQERLPFAYVFGRSTHYASIAAQVEATVTTAPGLGLYAVDKELDKYRDAAGVEHVYPFQMTNVEAAALMSGLRRATGRKVGLYHSLSGFPLGLGQDFNWVAKWGRTAPTTIPWTFWQDRGGPTDHDWFNGDRAALLRLAGLTPPDSSTGEDVDAKAAVPIAVADFGPGSSVYADLASTQSLIGSWPGGSNVGVYATGKRADGLAMDLVRLDFATAGTDLRAVWVGDDKRKGAFRVPGAAAGVPTVTVTSTGPLTLIAGPGVTVSK